jgi:hypothetical protein
MGERICESTKDPEETRNKKAYARKVEDEIGTKRIIDSAWASESANLVRNPEETRKRSISKLAYHY